MHGDFHAEKVDDRLSGGESFLSGYIQKVRAEEENVLYVVSRDMFRGFVINSEFKRLSTIEIMNLLGTDVGTLGNHEIDYGIGHLLFLEKYARFSIQLCKLWIRFLGTHGPSEWSNVLELNGGGTNEVPESSGQGQEKPSVTEWERCSLCGFCSIPLGLCLFIWIAIAVLAIVIVVLIIVIACRKRKCPRCKAVYEKHDKFCPECGDKLKNSN